MFSQGYKSFPGEVLPYKRLMGMHRRMGSHFHVWIDYIGVAFSMELLECGSTFSDFWCKKRGNEWSLRAFASMPSTAIFLRARAEIKNLLCELASNAKIWRARASEHSFKFCEQIEQR